MFLVTGGTGNVGANVVRELLDAGEEVRVLSREPGDRSFPDGVEAVPGDLTRPESLPAALSGVERAFLMSPAFAGVGGFLGAARRAGLRHVVVLSSASVLAETAGFVGEQHQRLDAVEEITGRQAFTYAQWAAHRAAAFDPAMV
ncbi:hypothetical protein GCM10014715_23890 [Streptomyces spiralis]|uniref:NAD(P)-binding domain-containing protein n=1 Tax=Streptomyces spiralis TaxID=66376 RepID=A0A918ZSZ6_9ACTN|nr:NAD(P)H-binding protein [Streptomyces spiralis]GHE69267.1 hypothetical protein GCM10014715_23890 [Streptomyces spiralis]